MQIPTANVLFLHKWFSLSGGVERVHRNLSLALAEQGVSSAFYVDDISGNKQAGFEQLQGAFNAYAPMQKEGRLNRLRHLFAHIEHHQVTVVIAATETANMLAFCCALKFPKLKVIYTRHCALDVSDQKLPPWMIKGLYNLYSLTNQTIVTVSDGLRKELSYAVRVGRSPIHFIPNAVVNPKIRDKAAQNTDGFDRQHYFCAVGRLVEQKGFDLLLQAYANAKRMALHAGQSLPELVIVGEGNDKDKLVRQCQKLGIENDVYFTGYTTNPYYIIKHAQAFVLSSRHEGMPTVLVEAMYLNTPVIAFDCPTGPGELIINKVNGILVPHMNINQLAQGMVNYRSLQHTDITKSVSHFQYENVALQYIQHFQG